ncbi:MAG: SUF system NifU family Fe-S cluster assembly protein [Bacteriovoracaceae bacterium]|jgi:nitrogen fixation protein NifU and related proteins|nr:SUF system NifU family Fe-S cluster assembly protein [Bacteriovoracaceae bacterium]
MTTNENMKELYQSVILDHNKNPKNFKKIEGHTHKQEGFNPVCGDHLHIYIKLSDDKATVEDVGFIGEGCAISKASASMMTQAIKGRPVQEVKDLYKDFHKLLTGKLDPENDENSLGKLQIFSGIWKYPARVKCATLSWHTMAAALDGEAGIIKTE